jgi:hypothetical protein
MKPNKNFALIAASLILISGCGSSQNDDTLQAETEVVSEAETVVNEVKSSLEYAMENRTSTYLYFPYFVDAPTLSVVSDKDFNNLEISIDANLYDEGIRDGSGLAIPLKEGSTQIVDTSRAINACAKDAVQDFATRIVFYLDGKYPKESLKIQMRFVTTVGQPTTDKYGNTDSSNVKEKVLASTLMHISRSNLDKIPDAFSPPDYFALSDLTAPKKYPNAWNRCERYAL